MLLQGGADPNNQSQLLPPLIAAVRAGDKQLVNLLIYFEANANIRIPYCTKHRFPVNISGEICIEIYCQHLELLKANIVDVKSI